MANIGVILMVIAVVAGVLAVAYVALYCLDKDVDQSAH
jgi:hypothetical protein